MAGVPVQYKGNQPASPSPIPAPGPSSLRPAESPRSPPSPSPEAAYNVPRPFTPPLGPVTDRRTNFTPPPTDSFEDPDTNSGFKPNLIPSAAQVSQRFSVFVLLAGYGVMALQFN